MHFCNLMFFMFSCGIDLLFILFSFGTMNAVFGQNTFTLILFYAMFAYFVIAFYIAFKAYQCFKKHFY